MLDTSKPLVLVTEWTGSNRVKPGPGERPVTLPEAVHRVEVTIDLSWLVFQLAEACLHNTTGRATELGGAVKAKLLKRE